MPRRVPLPTLGPSPTPITEYLGKHPDVSLMSLAKASGLHYDTVHKAEQGRRPPTFVTLLKLQNSVGIPVMAWAGTKAVKVEMERAVDPNHYNEKQCRYRAKKRANDPAFKAHDDERFKRRDARVAARKRGEVVSPVPMSPVKARLLGLPVGTLET